VTDRSGGLSGPAGSGRPNIRLTHNVRPFPIIIPKELCIMTLTDADRIAPDLSLQPAPVGRVRLRPVDPGDIPYLYRLATDGETGARWRYRGATPDPKAFAAQLYEGVLAQFIVERSADGTPVGMVCAYNANHRDGFVYLAGVSEPALQGTGLAPEGLVLLADHVFGNWSFRKIYFESASFNYEQFASGADVYFREEARLKDHTFYRGRYWDLVIGSLTREGLQRIREVREMHHLSTPGDDPLPDIQRFCIAVADALGLERSAVRPESRLVEDLGVDSLGALVLQDMIESDAGVSDFDLSEGLGTVRDTYLLYVTIASAPNV
jgi:RimJ/RimL family protein N-acetyltransferase/acyl carrier protein